MQMVSRCRKWRQLAMVSQATFNRCPIPHTPVPHRQSSCSTFWSSERPARRCWPSLQQLSTWLLSLASRTKYAQIIQTSWPKNIPLEGCKSYNPTGIWSSYCRHVQCQCPSSQVAIRLCAGGALGGVVFQGASLWSSHFKYCRISQCLDFRGVWETYSCNIWSHPSQANALVRWKIRKWA